MAIGRAEVVIKVEIAEWSLRRLEAIVAGLRELSDDRGQDPEQQPERRPVHARGHAERAGAETDRAGDE